MGWRDVIAYGDLGLRKAIAHYYKRREPITAEESQKFFDRFSPWKHLVGYYLLMDHIENGKNYTSYKK